VRRSFAQVAREARIAERRAAAAYARGFAADVAALAARKRLPVIEAEHLTRRINAFAEGLEQGLHLVGGAEPEAAGG
jgi:hypothetical protein